MTLVKDMETMNFLVSGSIGSGKTNLINAQSSPTGELKDRGGSNN